MSDVFWVSWVVICMFVGAYTIGSWAADLTILLLKKLK